MTSPFTSLFNPNLFPRAENTASFESFEEPSMVSFKSTTHVRSYADRKTEANPLSLSYFSQDNIRRVNLIIQLLVNESLPNGLKIDLQDETVLRQVMEEIYHMYSNLTQRPDYIPIEVKRLNAIVAERCVPIVLSNIALQIKFVNDKAGGFGGKLNQLGTASSVAGTRLTTDSSGLENSIKDYRTLDIRSLLPPLPKLF